MCDRICIVKLQKRLNRKVNDKEYSKWIVTLSPEDVEELGWKEGSELSSKIKDNKLILEEDASHKSK
jgi:hypothetical protein